MVTNYKCSINGPLSSHGKLVSSLLVFTDTYNILFLSRLFITRSYPEAKILEGQIKVITQLETSIGISYSKNLQMEIYSSTLGSRKCVFNQKLLGILKKLQQTLKSCFVQSHFVLTLMRKKQLLLTWNQTT